MPQSFWSDRRLLVTVHGPEGVRRVEADKPFALFGSHPKCDVVLAMSRIPRRCFCAVATAHGVAGAVLSDSSKRAGKFRLIDADRPVKLRSFQVRIAAGPGPEDDDSGDGPAPTQQDAEWAIKWTTSVGTQYFRLPSDRPVLVGRRHPSHVTIPDESLSAVHCCLYRHRQQLWVFDLCSSNGTWVQGQAVSAIELSLDDSFRIGGTRFRFVRRFAEDGVQSRERQLEEEFADFTRQRAGLMLQQQQWEAWRESEMSRQTEQDRQLTALRESHEVEKQEWESQRERHTAQFERQIRERTEQLSAARAALEQEREAWLLTTNLADKQLTLDRQQLEAERTNLHARTCELLQLQKRLDEQANQHAGTIDGLRRALKEARDKLAKLEAERQEWLMRRLRAQRALKEREQTVAAAEQEIARRETETATQRSQLRREQQELTDMRRRDLRLARHIAATRGSQLLADEPSVYSNHAWNLPALETCLFASDFITILDQAIEKANGTSAGD